MVDKGKAAQCHRCRSTSHLIEGDGPAVCSPCVLILGRVTRDPSSGTDRLVGMLDELHSDVVHLRSEDGVLSWVWTADWPAAGAR